MPKFCKNCLRHHTNETLRLESMLLRLRFKTHKSLLFLLLLLIQFNVGFTEMVPTIHKSLKYERFCIWIGQNPVLSCPNKTSWSSPIHVFKGKVM